MALKDLFKDNNDINEKSVVGFASFVIMVIFALADLITGYVGKDLGGTVCLRWRVTCCPSGMSSIGWAISVERPVHP